MILDKISAARRRTGLAASEPTPFMRRNEAVVEIYDNRTGSRFELTGSKDEWVKLTGRLMEVLAKYAERER